jgi:integrase
MNNSAWQKARNIAGLISVRVHDLRHTCATRLRAAGVAQKGRATLLGYATKTMAEHYAAADIVRLIKLSNLALEGNGTQTVLSVVNG